MIDFCTFSLPDADSTRLAGRSLIHSLYTFPVTIAVEGELGAGKTTFLQGFAQAFGVRGALTSPTYALEQHYRTPRGTLAHLDLYRLSAPDAKWLVLESDHAASIRCIEWPQRLGPQWHELIEPNMHIQLRDDGGPGRRLRCVFHDLPLPTDGEIETWRREAALAPHIAAHCDAVAAFADRCAQLLIETRAMIVRREALHCAARVHDLFRSIDFRDGASPEGFRATEEERERWRSLKERYSGVHHEAACEKFLRERGYEQLGTIVAAHGLTLPPSDEATIEQKLLFYADKRVAVDRIVSLEERFADFARRYGNTSLTVAVKDWFERTKAVERELFPEGIPKE
ncbi:tRNA (adenosine(37)-N6)-threonylcarbamoyltransferase complex ATPase subunit type 1 TsaE [Candidatus Peregrinibacteria bacterium]|nr:tRNA (adenosine(37)-N6)-threonylcarbamoyltransferase complex ATPase subunit type 1 TsaE [Candidatus Peregrinibacteria bacterium]MBI3816743.1 tRNA (adenosine(37)-N6)-threonylcarbamoyltransferase complex ATPase subunit type 1 TsaE [Candidatus Peregrinibacteria bacterium]